MDLSDKQTYVVPECQIIVLAAGSCILSGSTKGIDYEDM